MARPTENGLSYFPLDVDFDLDDKLQMIIAKYKSEGIAILIIVLCKIYDNGYFYKWQEQEQLLTARRVNSEFTTVNSVITDAIKFGFFDEAKFINYGILTSNGIQKRYFEATKKRKELIVTEEYLVNSNINLINSNINLINAVIKTQSKAKETIVKVKKTKEEKSNTNFEIFFNEYPRKDGRVLAQKSWEKLKMDEVLFNKIINAVKILKTTDQWIKDNQKFVPMASTFINQKRWEDEIKPESAKQSNEPKIIGHNWLGPVFQ